MSESAEQLSVRYGVPMIIAFVAVLIRAILTASRPTLLGVARGVAIGLFVGALVNLYLADQYPLLGDGARGAIVGVASIVAEDLVVALLVLGRRLQTHPERILGWLAPRKD